MQDALITTRLQIPFHYCLGILTSLLIRQFIWYIYIHIYETQSAQISQKQDEHNIYVIMKTMSRLSPQWLCGNSCTLAHDVRFDTLGHDRTSCAQVHKLPQNQCGDNREGTLYIQIDR